MSKTYTLEEIQRLAYIYQEVCEEHDMSSANTAVEFANWLLRADQLNDIKNECELMNVN